MSRIRGWGQWPCPLEASLLSSFLSITSALQRATPIDIISDDKGVIYKNWVGAELFFTWDASWERFFTGYIRFKGFFQFKTLRGFLLKMTFINVCLDFLSLIKINHVGGICFTDTSVYTTKLDSRFILVFRDINIFKS